MLICEFNKSKMKMIKARWKKKKAVEEQWIYDKRVKKK